MQVTTSLHRGVQQHPDRIATIHGARSRSFAESRDRIARLAGALRGLGVEAGDRVGILSLNSDRYHEYLLAVPWAGAVVNPVNIRWSAAEIAYSLRDSETRVLLVDDSFVGMLPAIRGEWDGIETVIHCGDGAAPQGTLSYEELVAAAQRAVDARRGGADLYGIFYTGGTTGFPKGVMLSHDNMVVSAMGALTTVEILPRAGRLLHAAPMFHLADIAAWGMGMLTGATHVIVPMFNPANVVEAITRHGADAALLVPTMLQMLADAPEAQAADLSCMRRVLYGASVISDSVLERATKMFPAAGFTQAYGMTELAPIATLLSPEDHQVERLRRSAGRAAAHVQVRIVGADGAEMPRGEVGEVVVTGDNVMLGYWNRPAETAAAIRDGWMHTGDGGYMDEAGYLYIVDRIKDMIITGGENVYSAEVENTVARHEAVAACAVIGLPDERWGERVHAVVVLKPEATVTAQEITDFCRNKIANYKLPRSIAFVDALPLSGAGKVLKRELRSMHWDDNGRPTATREEGARR